jgi:exopolysaccharide production protein ExoZ
MRTLVSIQYLRALAALSVMAYHTLLAVAPPGPEEPFSFYGFAFGVDIFFVVSGFIMWTTTAGTGRRPLDFLRARIVRIVPLYWLALAACLGVLWAGAGQLPRLDEIAKAYLFVPYIDSLTGLNAPYYTLGWTLNHEMFFYAVFAGALLCRSDAVRFGLVAAVLVMLVLLRPAIDAGDPVLFRITSPLLLEFLAGMAIAAVRQHQVLPPPAALAALLLALAFMVLLSGSHVESWPRAVYFGLPAALIVLGAVSLEEILARRPAPRLVLLGDASYSLYLSHDLVLKLAAAPLAAIVRLHPAAAFACALMLELALGAACYRRIERPLLGLWHGRRAPGRARQVRGAVAPHL